jgi:hypothetical protein
MSEPERDDVPEVRAAGVPAGRGAAPVTWLPGFVRRLVDALRAWRRARARSRRARREAVAAQRDWADFLRERRRERDRSYRRPSGPTGTIFAGPRWPRRPRRREP